MASLTGLAVCMRCDNFGGLCAAADTLLPPEKAYPASKTPTVTRMHVKQYYYYCEYIPTINLMGSGCSPRKFLHLLRCILSTNMTGYEKLRDRSW